TQRLPPQAAFAHGDGHSAEIMTSPCRRSAPMSEERIRNAPLRARVGDAATAAAHIAPGNTVAMSGLTGSGYPQLVPLALAERMGVAHAVGEAFQIRLLTGASPAPELDGALAEVDGIALRLPFQSDPDARQRIN